MLTRTGPSSSSPCYHHRVIITVLSRPVAVEVAFRALNEIMDFTQHKGPLGERSEGETAEGEAAEGGREGTFRPGSRSSGEPPPCPGLRRTWSCGSSSGLCEMTGQEEEIKRRS